MFRLVSMTVVATLIVFFGITFFHVIAPFLLPLFIAGVLAVLCQPIYARVLKWTNNRVSLAASISTVAILAILLVPILVITAVSAGQLYALAQESVGDRDWRETWQELREAVAFDDIAERVAKFAGVRYDAEEVHTALRKGVGDLMKSMAGQTLGIAKSALGLLGVLVSMTVGAMMFVIALYYFLADGPRLLAAAETLIPVHVKYQRELLREFHKVVRSVVVATFMAALGQGLATALGVYFIGGFHHFFLLVSVSTTSSLIPLAGTWLVWGPCAIWLISVGSYGAAAILSVYGVVVVGLLDNVIRTYILHTDAKLHPLLAFVSVLGGLQVMGLWGIFFGPIVACFLYALIQIFNAELTGYSREQDDEAAETGVKSQDDADGVPPESEVDNKEPTIDEAAKAENRKISEAPTEANPSPQPADTKKKRPRRRRRRSRR